MVDLARTVRQQQESLDGYATSMTCHLGDFVEYAGIRRTLSELEKQASRADQQSRAAADKRQRELNALRKRMREHGCHSCPDREAHARWAERWFKLKKQNEAITQQIRSRTGAVARVFDRVTDLLLGFGYLERDQSGKLLASDSGRMLRRIYGERDLLVAEALRRGLWNDLDAPSIAAIATTMVYTPRRDEGPLSERFLPRGNFLEALDATGTLWSDLDDLEREHKLPGSEPPATGLALAMWKWAKGAPLGEVLEDADMAAGDFVRWTKQTIDLLDQLSVVADNPVAANARIAMDSVRRGIVAYSSVA